MAVLSGYWNFKMIGNTYVVKRLMTRGVNVNAVDKYGNTGLHLANINNFKNIKKLIKEDNIL
jgi:ankyrin repeat protein